MMTKRQRIEDLERRVKELEGRLDEHEKLIHFSFVYPNPYIPYPPTTGVGITPSGWGEWVVTYMNDVCKYDI